MGGIMSVYIDWVSLIMRLAWDIALYLTRSRSIVNPEEKMQFWSLNPEGCSDTEGCNIFVAQDRREKMYLFCPLYPKDSDDIADIGIVVPLEQTRIDVEQKIPKGESANPEIRCLLMRLAFDLFLGLVMGWTQSTGSGSRIHPFRITKLCSTLMIFILIDSIIMK